MAAQPLCNFSPGCDVRGSVVVPALIYYSDNGVSESNANEKRYREWKFTTAHRKDAC